MPRVAWLPRREASFSIRFALILGLLGIFIAGASAALPLSGARTTNRQAALDRASDRATVAGNLLTAQLRSIADFSRGVAMQLVTVGAPSTDTATLRVFLIRLATQAGAGDVVGIRRSADVLAVRGGTTVDSGVAPASWLARLDAGVNGVIAATDGAPWMVETAAVPGSTSVSFVARPIDAGVLRAIDAQLGTSANTDVALVRQGRIAVSAPIAGLRFDPGAELPTALRDAVAMGAATVLDAGSGDTGLAVAHLGGGYDLVATTSVTGTAGFITTVAAPVVVVAAAVLVLALLLVYVVVARNLQRPLRRLDRAVEALAHEDFDVPVPTGGDDAIGRLAASFDTMRRELRDVLRTAEARAEMAIQLSSVQPLSDALDNACVLLRDTTGSGAALIVLASGSGSAVHQSGLDRIDDGAILLSGDGPLAVGSHLDRLEPLLVSALAGSLEAAAGMRDLCVAPLVIGGRSLGGAVALADRPDGFRSADQHLVAAAAEQVALAVERDRLLEQARYQACTDGLTGLYNYRFLVDYLDRQVAIAQRSGSPLSILMLDLDHFKLLNDIHGHLAGDQALRLLSGTLQNALRRSDLAARYGGEEFVVVMANTESQEARIVAEKIRAAVAATDLALDGDHSPQAITVSIGVAAFPESAQSSRDLVAVADACLYAAKEAGRDRVCFAGEQPSGDSSQRLRGRRPTPSEAS
ncbi:MAG TPA: diguanylate cyclase [Candidatus Dormibacteraeota bacterium]|nr:diguanylate cyclase [Candidatus Dormibacteraeota bacterium]